MPVLPLSPNRLEATGRHHERPLVIGLVNNMPDKALASTERQFRDVLANATGSLPVVMRIFAIPDAPRSAVARDYVRTSYEDIDNLWGADLDGLIVTGTEPRAADLTEETYWRTLTRLVDWVAEFAVPSVWSCLAAHAAVRYLDGIDRRARAGKLSGVFDCVKTADHPLVAQGPGRWCTPHSRYNDLPEDELAAHGYQILAHASGAGADLFVKRFGGVFLFTQGHPEYDPEALLREYRRDVGRYLAGTVEQYPEMPSGYFDSAATAMLTEFRETALRHRDAALLAAFPSDVARRSLTGPWRAAAAGLYANWLAHVTAERALRRAAGSPALPEKTRVGAYG